MQDVLEAIRAAIAADATPEARAAGADACRMILAALDAKPGEPLMTAITAPPSPVAALVAGLRGVPADKLLDVAIAKLRAALPADAELAPVAPLRFHIVPAPSTRAKTCAK